MRPAIGYDAPFENVTAFKYLGRVMMAGDYVWAEVVGKLQRARGRLLRILSREGADPKVSGIFFKAVTQAVLLFGEKTWVLTPRTERALCSFQYRVAQRLTGRQSRRRGGGSWEYPSFEEAMEESGFEGVGKYITTRQNTVAQYIAARHILDLCERSARSPGARVSWRWWEQAGLYLEEAKKRAAAAAEELD